MPSWVPVAWEGIFSRYPRAYAAWHLKFKLKLNVPFVHSFLMVHIPPDHRLIQPNGRRKEPRRPQYSSPIPLLQLGVSETELPTQIRFHLAHNARHRIFRRNHQHHMNMVYLNTPLLNQHIGMILLDLRYLLLHKDLEASPQNASAVFGDPHHMVLMLVRPMSTETNFHA
jgi:hypothetical protein